MTNGNGPSAVAGDTLQIPAFGGVPLRFVFPQMLSGPGYTDLPTYWSPRRDAHLANTIHKEDMWASAVARTATKFAAHGYIVKDSEDSTRKVSASQVLLKRANGGEGWVPFALKVVQDLLTTDNGIFIRVRRAGEQVTTIRAKAKEDQFTDVILAQSTGAAKITGLYHLDSLRCTRTGNLAYPVRYQPISGPALLLRWDQVLFYADMPSSRAELFGVGFCAASRAYKTINKLAAIEQMVYEFATGSGANKLAILQGIQEQTLKDLIKAGVTENQAKGFVYYLGTILGAIPGDTPISLVEVILKQLAEGFTAKDERDNAYLIYANAIGVPVQDIQPLSGQGFGTGAQTVILQEQAQGIGIAAFVKWWEQTVSDRVLPATTELEFINENDTRDQKAKAEVSKMRADERAARIGSGEISPAVARQLAADAGDLPKDLVARDATPGGQLSDDEKPMGEARPNQAALQLIAGEPTAPPKQSAPGVATKASGHTGVMVALYPDTQTARKLAALPGATEPADELHLTLCFLGDSTEQPLAERKAQLDEGIREWAAAHGQALQGTINGAGRFFHTEEDGTNAVYVAPDVPGLPELRQSLVSWIEQLGLDYAQNHGFTPHITVAYVPKDAPTPPIRVEMPVSFDRVTLAWGDERTDYPLLRVATKSADLFERELADARALAGWARE